MTRERDQVESVVVNLGGEDVSLRLDMAALADFEQAAGITVPQFLRPLADVMQALAGDTQASVVMQAVAAGADVSEIEDADAAGLRMIDEILAAETVSARNLMILAWALAGGEDRDDTPREFGRRIGIVSGRELVTGVMQAIKDGMPAADADAEDEAPEDADPTTSPE